MPGSVAVQWPDEVDEILGGDLVVTVASPTPAGGVVLNSVTPLGLRDRDAGTVTFTTSLGFGKKLERIAADPRMAVAYHTRRHGHSQRPGLVVVQGVASIIAGYTDAQRDEVRADGMPLIVPIGVGGTAGDGLVLDVPREVVPDGARRAGLIAHSFNPKLIGLSTATHTGWLEVGARAIWTPHTRHAFRAPPNKTLLLLGNGGAARWGYRQAIKQGRGDIVKYAARTPS